MRPQNITCSPLQQFPVFYGRRIFRGSSALLHKPPDAVPKQVLLRLALVPPYLPLYPNIHPLDPQVRRAIQLAPVEPAAPQGGPQALPPCDVLVRAQDVLVEHERPPRLQDVVDESGDGTLGLGDRADRKHRDDRIGRVRPPERGRDQRRLLRATREDQEVSRRLSVALRLGPGADLLVHVCIGLEGNVFGHLGGVEVEDGVSVAFLSKRGASVSSDSVLLGPTPGRVI